VALEPVDVENVARHGSAAGDRLDPERRLIVQSESASNIIDSLHAAERPAITGVSWADVVAGMLLTFGTLVRLREWMAGRSLWMDEATLSLNLIGRDLTGLLGPLDYGQMAPPGYLWTVKGIISLTGPGELSLRALSMAAGIGLIVAGWWLTRRLMGRWPATAAAAILALSPGAVYYSNEVKPYSSDAFVAAVLLLAGTSAIDREVTWRRTALLAALGATAVWVSYPAPFTLVGVGLALAVASAHRKDWGAVSRLGVVGLAWTGSWGVVYHLARQGSTYDYMQRYWRDQFLDLSLAAPYRTATALVQALDVPGQTFRSPLDPWNAAVRITAVMLVLLALGIWALAVQRKVPALVMLLSAPLMALTAAVAHVYPIDVRLILFMLPSLAALAAGGLWFLSSRGLPWVAVLIIAITLLWSLLADLQTLRGPSEREDAKGVLRVLSSEARPGDTVYVWHGRASPLNFYRLTRPSLWPADVQTVWGAFLSAPVQTPIEKTEKYLEEIGWLCGRPRVWVALVHGYPPEVYHNVFAVLRTRGAIVTSRTFDGAELAFLDLHNLPCQQSAAGQ
jgi:4-amino-4-deoxy-L-arabinose transferase-like glycosyltransferase